MGSKISSRRGGCHARCQLPDSAVEDAGVSGGVHISGILVEGEIYRTTYKDILAGVFTPILSRRFFRQSHWWYFFLGIHGPSNHKVFVSFFFPRIFVWGSCFWFCIPSRLRPASVPPLPPPPCPTPPSFTHNFVTHHLSHTHNFATHHLTPSFTQLCHTPSFTHNFTTQHLTPSFTHNFVTHSLSHTTSSHHLTRRRGTWGPSPSFCVVAWCVIWCSPICSRIAVTHRGKKHLHPLIFVAMHVCVLLGHAERPMVICHPVDRWKHLHRSVVCHCTQSFTHIIVSHTSFTHNFITHNSSHTTLFTSRSSTTSFVFPSFPVPLQLLLLIIGRSWLVGLSGPLIFKVQVFSSPRLWGFLWVSLEMVGWCF